MLRPKRNDRPVLLNLPIQILDGDFGWPCARTFWLKGHAAFARSLRLSRPFRRLGHIFCRAGHTERPHK
jgi:hypothetical protein